MQKFIQRSLSDMAASPIQGVHLFLMQYRDGNYGKDARTRSDVKYRLVSGDDAKTRARAIHPLEFSEGNEYASVLVIFDAPVASFKNLRVHGRAYCARCNAPVTFICDCVGRNSRINSQPCPRCEKPIHISAGTLVDDEKCSELWVIAGMTDHLKAEPVSGMAVHSVKQVASILKSP